MTASDWIALAGVVAWPIAIIVIAVAAFLFFRRPITDLIDRIGRVEIPNRLLLESFAGEERSADVDGTIDQTQVASIEWKPASLYLLGIALGWAVIGAYMDEKALIEKGMENAILRAGELNLSSTIIERLRVVLNSLEERKEIPLDEAWRKSQISELSAISSIIAELTKVSQPDFKLEPDD